MFRGGLVTEYFLVEGIVETDAWKALDAAAADRVRAVLEGHLDALLRTRNPTEADTEGTLIWPVLEALGWADMKTQQNLSPKGRQDVPDVLLFGSAADKTLADSLDAYLRYRHGLCVVESKRWGRPLDRESKGAKADTGVPSSQMLRYLRRVDDLTQGKLRWGVLTNGAVWRLYWQGAVSVAEDFFEIDLAKVLGRAEPDLLDRSALPGADLEALRTHALRLFILFFGRAGFVADHAGGSFLDRALKEGAFWEERVARDLSDTVFDRVFPQLANAIVAADRAGGSTADPAYLQEVQDGALVLLYRLLFVLYAEDRNLLPDESGPYADYALTRIRLQIAQRKADGLPFSAVATSLWGKLADIFRAIADGDDALGIPPYNGGLFAEGTAPVLARVRVPDAVMADVIFALSHVEDVKGGREPRYVNYRDLSVQQLGSVYERILEHGVRARADGTVEIAADESARHDSGSFYTHEELVTLVIERTVGPLVAERRDAFAAAAAELAHDRGAVAGRLERLAALDPASRMLELKVCDPAMGSGHFLVSLVDWLADRVLAAMEEAALLVEWGVYVSPLAARIAAVRDGIAATAAARGWPVRDGQLDDRHIVRRMILKRVVHGADKNRMAVELAKVSLWLHSFTVGAPLSFLDHHLRWGDSVVGAWTRPVRDELERRGALFNPGIISRVERAADGMRRVEASNDSDLSEVGRSKAAFAAVEEETSPVAALFSLLTAERIMGVFGKAPRKAPKALPSTATPAQRDKAAADALAYRREAAFKSVIDSVYGDPAAIAAGLVPVVPAGMDPVPDERRVAADLVAEARALADRHRFLHWQIAFPNVWSDLASLDPDGGFDAVIGNPPYVRQERLGELKPALKPRHDDAGLDRPRDGDRPEVWAQWRRGLLRARAGYLAFDGMADLYVYFYELGLRLLRPGGRMGYVVTNKWLKAGYAEALRGLFADAAQVAFIADFGHAKHFFRDADVFPSVLVARRPEPGTEPAAADTLSACVIPRDAVPEKGVGAAVAAAEYPMPRAVFTRQSWTLEPPDVMALLDKIRRNGVPLAEYAGVKPLYGIKTGFNEAFLIDTVTRDRLVRDDPNSADIIKPYLRGQDVERWVSPDSGLFMIVMKSSGDHAWPWATCSDDATAEECFRQSFPALHRHFKHYEPQLRARQDKGRFWWELRSCSYYQMFKESRIVYQEIQYYPSFSFELREIYGNNKTFFIMSGDKHLFMVLNSPLMWWFNWRYLPHMKDEALTPVGVRMEALPIASRQLECGELVASTVVAVQTVARNAPVVHDWLRHEFGLEKPGSALAEPHRLDAEGFVAAVKGALPKKRRLSPGDVAALKAAYADTVVPARAAAAEVLRLERRLSDLVNAAYGLTAEEVALMWRTAPPRMPLDPAEELARLGCSPSPAAGSG